MFNHQNNQELKKDTVWALGYLYYYLLIIYNKVIAVATSMKGIFKVLMMGSCMFSVLLYTHSDYSSPCFRPSAVLYKPNWEGELRRVLNSKVVAHELSHFWFGNLVTPRWWDALWLSEGAATFFASLILNKVGTVQFSVPLIKFRL